MKETRKAKNQAMAARMKQTGERRNSARCPMPGCNAIVALNRLYQHVATACRGK